LESSLGEEGKKEEKSGRYCNRHFLKILAREY